MQLQTTLMPHQEAAIRKRLPVRVGGLFMDMGTGKSRTVIGLAAHRLAAGKIRRILWFTPVTLKDNVRREILKHTGTDHNVHVFNVKTSDGNLPEVLWYVIGIESMSSSNRVVLAVNALMSEDSMVVVDESSYIKGHRSKRAQRIEMISSKARYREILTGTPISQGVVDLYSQMRFLSPQILGYTGFYSFAHNHLEYSERYKGMIVRCHNTEHLANKIAPYVYQVTKDECLNLPAKQFINRWHDLDEFQQERYTQVKEVFLSMLVSAEEEQWRNSVVIFRLFMALQQVACGYWNQTEAMFYRVTENRRLVTREHDSQLHEISNNRLKLLDDVVQEIALHEQIVIWTKSRYSLAKIAARLRKRWGNESVCEYHGGLNEKQRNESESRFHAGAKFFVGTPSSGGHGLTLIEAAYVIFYDNSFKYAERIQAEDRCHRIGQSRKVTYISLWADCGIEERIHWAIESKGNALANFREEIETVKGQIDKGVLKKIVEKL